MTDTVATNGIIGPDLLVLQVHDFERAVALYEHELGLERKATFRDPDGNEIGFGGAPAAETGGRPT